MQWTLELRTSGSDKLTVACWRLRWTRTADASWISLPSNTPQPASTTATRFPMLLNWNHKLNKIAVNLKVVNEQWTYEVCQWTAPLPTADGRESVDATIPKWFLLSSLWNESLKWVFWTVKRINDSLSRRTWLNSVEDCRAETWRKAVTSDLHVGI